MDGFVIRGRKRYVDIRFTSFVGDTQPVLGDGRSVLFNFVENLFSFCSNRCLLLVSMQIPRPEAGQQEPEVRDGHGEGGAVWLRAELEAKSRADLRKLCAKLELPQWRDGATLRKEQLLEPMVDSFSSQEGWSQGMGVERCSTLRAIGFS